MITVGPPKDWGFAVAAMARLAACDWVVFTSKNGVAFTARALGEAGLDARALGAAKIAAIGSATADALGAILGLTAHLVPVASRGEGLATEILDALGGTHATIMILRAQVARPALPDALRAAGCTVEIVPVYETRGPDLASVAPVAEELAAGTIDAVLFTSGSTVNNLCDALGARAAELLGRARVASIGPVTTEACARRGVRVDVTAGGASLDRLVADLEAAFRQ